MYFSEGLRYYFGMISKVVNKAEKIFQTSETARQCVWVHV